MGKKLTYEELELKVKKLDTKTKKLKQIEKTLKEKITELNSFINNVPDMAWIKDIESRFIAVNKAFSETVGMNPESLINQTCEVCFGKEAAKKFREDDQEVMKGKKQVTIVEKIKDSKKNEEIWLETIKSPIFNESGRVSGTVGIARDITHRKLTEKKVQDSEKRFRLIFENSSDGIIVADPETMKFIYVNPAICKILGYTEEELKQMGVVDIHPKESLEHVVSEFKAQARGKKLLAANIPFLKKNEKIIYMDTNSSIVRMGQEIRIMGVFRDVTERKQVEEELWKSKKRYRAVVESQTEMICRYLPGGTISFVNEAYCRYFNKSRKELIGQNFLFLIPDEDRKKVFENIASLTQNNPVMTHEHRVVNPNGEICWHRWTNRAIFDDQNEMTEFQSVGWDITERVLTEKALMESEKRYRNLIETMNDGIKIQDEKGIITYVNSKFGQMLGYKPENLIGKPVSDFLDDRNKQILKNQISIRKKGDVSPYEIEWISKDGKNIPTIMSPQAIFDEKGQFKGSFSVITDISILKQVEEELRKTRDKLEAHVAERTRELEVQKGNLEEANIGLQVLLEKRQEDKKEIEDSTLTNVKELIMPYFEKIKKTKLDDQQKTFLSIMESNLNEIISPFSRKMSLKYLNLTPTEIQVANLIRHGSNSKEIADILGLSPRTIYNHRKNIRNKFGLKNKKTNLRSHLLSTH
jgi:PAS domain S-box-containing protein